MVKFFQQTHKYEYSWDLVTYAYWLRYPNPFASHVLASDVIERTIDEKTGIMKTIRILHKRGIIPKWGRSLLKHGEAYIMEVSIVDPARKIMKTKTFNLNHTKVMKVEEFQTYTCDSKNSNNTVVKTEAKVVSNFGLGLANQLEKFGIKKFVENSLRSRNGMAYVLKILAQNPLF